MLSSKGRLKLFSDENAPKKVVELLKKEGFDVKEADFRSVDGHIAAAAKGEKRVIPLI